MDISLKQQRAKELAEFLKIGPAEIPTPKEYFKTQKVRIAIEKSIKDYQKEFTDYLEKSKLEAKPFQEQYAKLEGEFRASNGKMTPEEKSKIVFRNGFTPGQNEELQAKNKELGRQLGDLMQPFQDSIDKYRKDNGDKLVTITVNPEDLNQVRIYFESKGSKHWLDGDAYLEVAEAIGCLEEAVK